MSHAANTSIQDIQNGIGDFVLRPEAGKRISSELKLEHASDAHARTEPSRAYIQGCKAARSLLEDTIRDMTQEQGTL